MKKREIFAWTLYDWANSAYSTLQITIVMKYLTQVVLPNRGGDVLYGYGIGLTMFCSALLSPVVGAMADARANKRAWLAWTTLPAAVAAVAMGFVSPHFPWVVAGLFVITNLGYEMAWGFYNAFLPEIADEKSMNRVSSYGFALGYIGGGLALIAAILVLQFGGKLGLADADALKRDFVHGPRVEFAVELPPGDYELSLTIGDAIAARKGLGIAIQGLPVDTISTAKGEIVTRTYPATVSENRLTVLVEPARGAPADVVLNGLSIEGSALPAPLLFDFGTSGSAAADRSLWATEADEFGVHDEASLKEHAKNIPAEELPHELSYGFLNAPGELGSLDSVEVPRLQAGLVIMGLWWGLFSLPTIIILRDRGTPSVGRQSFAKTAQSAFRQVGTTLASVRVYRALFLFLIAFLIYNDGVQTIITQAGLFATAVVHITASELVLVVLMIQFVSMPGALLMGWLAGKMGEKPTLMLCIGIYVAWLVAAFFIGTKMQFHVMGETYVITTRMQFWALGVVLALVMGGIQSVSRAIMGLMTPASRSGEFFGFFNLSGKATSVAGPILFVSILHWTGQANLAIVSLLVFFVVGGALAWRVNVQEGHRRAMAE
ncbi:MAG: MFS transporter [Planctomycetia bacterium]|nr:MFS transporter [Planctomycetia bacterium]